MDSTTHTHTVIHAHYANNEDAARGIAALMDRGVKGENISVIHRHPFDAVPTIDNEDQKSLDTARSGITTTTADDAATGAVKGTAAGIGIGALAAILSLTVPGFGIVLGGGALATALAGAAGAAGAGAIAGGVAGYLKDQGMKDALATEIHGIVERGGVYVNIALEQGDISLLDAEALIAKYGGTVHRDTGMTTVYNRAAVVMDEDVAVRSETIQTDGHIRADIDSANRAAIEPDDVRPVTGERIEDEFSQRPL